MNDKIITIAGYFAMTGWTFNLAFLLGTAVESYKKAPSQRSFWLLSLVMLSSPFFCVYIAIPYINKKLIKLTEY